MRIFVGASLLALAGLSAGCGRDFAIPELGADIVPPALASLEASPAFAGDGATIEILLEATEALPPTDRAGSANPVVELLDADGSTFQATCTGDATTRSCTLVVDAAIAEGPAEVVVTLEDAAGNSSGRFDTRSLVRIDRTEPTLLLTMTPNPTSRGELVELEVVSLFELLGATPILESPILENLSCLGIPPTGRFDCTAYVTNTQLTESDQVTARAVDLAGNEGSIIEYLYLQDPAPELSPLTVSQNPVKGGETIVLHTESTFEVMRCDGTVGGQVAPCTADEAGLVIDCSFVVPATMSEGAYRTEIVCENFTGFARTSGELWVDREIPVVHAGTILERTPGGVADAAVGLAGAVSDPIGTLDYPGRGVARVLFQSQFQTLAEGPVNADGSFRLPLPPDAGCEVNASTSALHIVAVDAAGNASSEVIPEVFNATLRPGLETCLNTRRQTVVAVEYAGKAPGLVSPGHLLTAGTVQSDPGPLSAADGDSLAVTGAAVDASIAAAVQVTPLSSPPARHFAAMAYHPPSGKVVLFGGVSGGTIYNDTWTYDGTDWTLASPTNVPDPRCRHAMVYDPLEGRLLMAGGTDNPTDGNPPFVDSLWAWDGSDWSHLGDGPSVWGHQLVYDSERFQILSVGGTHGIGPIAEYARVLRPDGTLVNLSALGAAPGPNQGSAYDAAAGRVVVYSAIGSVHFEFDIAASRWRSGFATPPLEYPALTYAAGAGRVIAHGGLQGGTSASSGFRRLDRDTADWVTVASSNANHYQQAAAYDRGRDVVVTFGGEPLGAETNELTFREARTTTAAHAFAIHAPHDSGQSLTSATLTWVGSGSGDANGDGTPDPGATLGLFQSPFQWIDVESHAASPADPALARTLSLEFESDSFVNGNPLWVVARALPSGAPGAGGPSSELVSDQVVVQLTIDR